ncbi:MAG: AfsA-related hotdog domain-containing protein [Nitrospirota bacterium]
MGLSSKYKEYDVDNEVVIERIKQILSDFRQRNPYISDISKIARKFVHKKNDEQVIISDILEIVQNHNLDALKGAVVSIYYAHACPNLRCPVVFDHPLDHYPMAKLFELGRQLGIAVCHRFNNVPLTGFMFVVGCIFIDLALLERVWVKMTHKLLIR